jgi:hypothetical protein
MAVMLSVTYAECHMYKPVMQSVFTLNVVMLSVVAPSASVFVPGKPFQPSLMFAGKAGAYPSETPFRCSTLASPANIRLDLPGANTLAYNENA